VDQEPLWNKEVTKSIIGASMDVLNELRTGLDEKLYERVLVIGLAERKHEIFSQQAFPVEYKGHPIVIVHRRGL